MKSIWLELIIEAEKNQSITKAAEICSLSQSAASRMIMSAETELNVKLFDRSSKMGGIKMTSSGLELLPYMKEAYNANKRLEEKAKRIHTSVLRLGMSEDAMGASARNRFLAGFYELHPDITLKIDVFKEDSLIDNLLSEQLDVILFSRAVEYDKNVEDPYVMRPVKVRELGSRPISLAIGTAHIPEYCSCGSIRLADLKDLTFIMHNDIKKMEKDGKKRFFFLDACRSKGFEPKLLTVENSTDIKHIMAENGKGVFLSSAPEKLREYPGVSFIPISDCPYYTKYYYINRRGNRNSYITELYEYLKTFF